MHRRESLVAIPLTFFTLAEVMANGLESTDAKVSPTEVATELPIKKGRLCINFGNQGKPATEAQWKAELQTLQDAGFKCLRIVRSGPQNEGILNAAKVAHDMGFAINVGSDTDKLSKDNMDAYREGVRKNAKMAQDLGYEDYSIANEMEEGRLDGVTFDEWVVFAKSLADDIKSDGYKGRVHVDISGDRAKEWAQVEDLGNIDVVSVNTYCGLSCEKDQIQVLRDAHGKNHVDISEYNTSDIDAGTVSDATHTASLKNELPQLREAFPDMDINYFTAYTGLNNETGVPARYGVFQNGKLVQANTWAFLGKEVKK